MDKSDAKASAELVSLVSAEWRAYLEPLAPIAERLVHRLPDAHDPQVRQEFYRVLFSTLSMAYMDLLVADPEHPEFVPIFNRVQNFLGPNPDNSYYATPIDGNGIYKISGFRGTVRIVDFAIGSGQMYPRGVGDKPGPTLVNHDIDSLHIEKDGAFEVVLSTQRPTGHKGDWWKLDSQATHIWIRQTAYDWLHEVDGRFAIERLDRQAIKPRPSAESIAVNLRQIPAFVENWTSWAFTYYEMAYHAKGLVNKVVVNRTGEFGGVSTLMYAGGLFDLGPDEALIYETAVPKQYRYWSIQLLDMFFGMIDSMNGQSSLNAHTSRLDTDGKFRYVISATDPGVPNWLDTGGYGKGSMLGRWVECGDAPAPILTKVKLAEVRKHLPPDTPLVSAEERDAAIRLRRKGAQLRRRW